MFHLRLDEFTSLNVALCLLHRIHKLCLCYSRKQEKSVSTAYFVPTVAQRQSATAPDDNQKQATKRFSLPPLQLASNCYSVKYGHKCQQLVRQYLERLRELERRMPYNIQLQSSFNLHISQAIKSTTKEQHGDFSKAADNKSLILPTEFGIAKNLTVDQTHLMLEYEWLTIKHMLWRNQLDVEFVGSIAGLTAPVESVPRHVPFVNLDLLNVDELGRLAVSAALNSRTS